MFVYAVLAAAASLGMKKIGSCGWRWAVISLLIVICAAAADEWNQSRHQSRTGIVADVGVDALGGIIGIGSFYTLSRFFSDTKTKHDRTA